MNFREIRTRMQKLWDEAAANEPTLQQRVDAVLGLSIPTEIHTNVKRLHRRRRRVAKRLLKDIEHAKAKLRAGGYPIE